MVIRYKVWNGDFDDKYLEKNMTKAANLKIWISRDEAERDLKGIREGKWDTKSLGRYRGAKFASVLQTALELMLMGLIEHVFSVDGKTYCVNYGEKDGGDGNDHGGDGDLV